MDLLNFGASIGAAASYRYLVANQHGIEMSKAIPGFSQRYDIANLAACFSPRPLLIVSAAEDWPRTMRLW